MTTPSSDAPRSRPPAVSGRSWNWRSRAFRGLVYQVLAIALIALGVWVLASNTLANMRTRGIQSGFGFLTQTAGFDIGESLIAFDSGESYLKAFTVGLINTVRVALIGIVLTTVLGTLLGVGRFSRNALVRGLCSAYVEIFRNIPILLQLLMWYLLFTEVLPEAQEPLTLGPVFLSKVGMNFPIPVWEAGHAWMAAGLVIGFVGAIGLRRRAQHRFEQTGQVGSFWGLPALAVLTGGLLGWLAGGTPMAWNVPTLGEFAVEDGGALTPEFLALLVGLTIYTAAFVAEVVRAGISSVPGGQAEAAAALGLSRGQAMKLVMLPQALRVIIPPLTNQYLNLTKNSSLAVAIGYPDVVSIANTSLNQTGRAVECIAIVMLVYLITSLSTSALMNWTNARAALKER